MAARVVMGSLGAATAYVIGNYQFSKGKPLNVNVPHPRMEVGGVNIFPVVSAVFGSLPQSVRKSILVKDQAPSSDNVMDVKDILGENAYTIKEVKRGQVWSVTYAMANHFMEKKGRDMMKIMNMDFTNEEGAWRVMQGAEAFGREASTKAHEDLARLREAISICEKFDEGKASKAEAVKASGPFLQNMIVVKLNSGSLLLYNPVQLKDPEFVAWLEKQGKVEWLVSGSSAHTLCLPNVIQRFPDAKIVAPKEVETKLNVNFPLKRKTLDYNTNDPTELFEANKELRPEGVSLHSLNGDVVCNGVIAVAHRTALECDVVYSHENGIGIVDNKDDFLKSDAHYFDRLFKFGLCSKPNSVNDALPHYRFQMMDPSGPMRNMLISPQMKRDGSSARDMANSLRLVLVQDFDTAVGAHSGIMSGDNFRRSVDKNWSWLDGGSLLDQSGAFSATGPDFSK